MPPVIVLIWVGQRGVGDWDSQAIWVIVGIAISGMPPVVWFYARRNYWAICWLWFGSLALVVVHAVFLVIATAVPFGWYEVRNPKPERLAWVALIVFLVFLPLIWNVARLLRNSYFQPWTTQDQWEYGAAKDLPEAKQSMLAAYIIVRWVVYLTYRLITLVAR